MTDNRESTRRTFLKGSAVLAAPLAMAMPVAAMAADDRAVRLQRLEDEAAIRALHQDWLRRVNAREADMAGLFVNASAARCLDSAVCGVASAPGAAQGDRIELAADGKRATGRFLCLIETESRMAPDSTLAQMALAQGGGVSRDQTSRRVRADYVKTGDRWAIAAIELAEV
ncbi:MAG TPA: twin-arginine translocation signal domain-containing protein [Sphingobium sp.]|nr:twin-arginine translocation signal domain-containing protein [Sphingobium sp.]